MISSNFFGLAAALTLFQSTFANCTPGDSTLYYDVAVIGGGAGGTYAAMGLLDAGKKVVVIEKEARLGGHAHTYIDPASGVPINYGVQLFHDNDLVKTYFARFGLNTTLVPIQGTGTPPTALLADFHTGAALNITLASADLGALVTALTTYSGIASNYSQFLASGFNLPEVMPEELVMPFGDFVAKYNLAAAVPIIAQISQGIGNILEVPTLYAFQYFPAEYFQYLVNGFRVPADGKVTTMYDMAATELGENALLSSNITAVDRHTSDNVTLTVTTPTGVKTIIATRLVMAIQPTVANLEPFLDLTDEERELFGKFTHTGYYPAVLSDTGIPDNISVQFYDANTPINLPPMPGAYIIQPSIVPGVKLAYYGTARTAGANPSKEAVLGELMAGFGRLASGGAVPTASGNPTVLKVEDHGAFCLQVSAEEIKAGFYKKINRLQNSSKTFWTGATWIAHSSSSIWKFTDLLLPYIVDAV